MIATVGLAPGLVRALTPDEQPDDLAELIDRHDTVIDTLRKHACVITASEQELRDLRKAVKALRTVSSDVQKRWDAALTHLANHRRLAPLDPPAVPPLDDLSRNSDLLPLWEGHVEVLALPTQQAVALGVDRRQASVVDPESKVEIAKGPLLHRSRRMTSFARLADSGVAGHGSDRDDWLTKVLLPVVRHATAIDIVDHYLYRELVKRRSARRRDEEPEHLGWLLNAIKHAGGPRKRIRLLGGVNEEGLPRDAYAAADLVRSACPSLGPNIEDLAIVGAPWSTRDDRLPHDRHISCDLGVAIEIPAGLNRFRCTQIEDDSGVSWTFRATQRAYRKCHKERELILRAFGVRTAHY